MDKEDEITESTVIAKQKRRRPSFWTNVGILVALAAVILFAQEMSRKWITPDLPEEEIEAGIVLEDLETEKPLAESEVVEVPSVPDVEIKEGVEKLLETAPPQPAPAPKPVAVKAIQKPVKKISPYAKDPYTNGGPLDLDRSENRDKYFPNRPAAKTERREATATPLLPTERDRFIPFEKE